MRLLTRLLFNAKPFCEISRKVLESNYVICDGQWLKHRDNPQIITTKEWDDDTLYIVEYHNKFNKTLVLKTI